MKRLCFIGGDKRQIRVIKNLSEIFPETKIYGFGKCETEFNGKAEVAEDIKGAVRDSDVIICPLPYSVDGERVNAPFSENEIFFEEIVRSVNKNQLLLIGKADENSHKLTKFYNVRCEDYLEREELAVLNSIPTAEGAIEIAMRETPFTISGSRCLILGNGRIGKILAKMLCGIGADVTVCVRKYKDIAWCRAMGYKSTTYEEIDEKLRGSHVIFNTVPFLVLGEERLKSVKTDALIIDLASKPGGVDFDLDKLS